jgi:tetratricopeptide (TPR) repeat protein
MKLNKLFTVLFLVAGFAFTAPVLKAQTSSLTGKNLKMYNMALEYGDYGVAINTLYTILADNPNDMALKDSLASLYFNSRAYPQAILVAREILAKNPKDKKMLELTAISYQNIGGAKEALETYETLYKESQMVYHLYQIAVLQYQIRRFGECEASLARILKDPASANEKVVINVNRTERQEVPMHAAVYNVLGMLALEQSDEASAKKAFEKALSIDGEFVLPKGNLEAMEQMKKQGQPGTQGGQR